MFHLLHHRALYVDPVQIALLHQPIDPQIPLINNRLYKHIVDEAPLHAPLLAQVGCEFATLPFEVGSIHLSSSALDHLRIEDNLHTLSLEDGKRQPDSIVEMEYGIIERQHPRLKGNVQLHHFFPSKNAAIVSPRFCHPSHSEEMLPLGCSSSPLKQPEVKSVGF